jgi:hypothetical protein
MSLLDHFHEPLYPKHSWQSFHARWAVAIMDALNRCLPAPRYLAEVQVKAGTQIEADVAEFELPPPDEMQGPTGDGVAVQTWAPPTATQTVAMIFPDDMEVQVLDTRGGARLVAVVELISPSNKDRPVSRRAFAAKCVAYLQRGIGLIIVDIVTERRGNLHGEVLNLLGHADTVLAQDTELYAVAYRPAHRAEVNQLDLWPVPLALGQPLPLLPLALRGAIFVPVDLEATYTETRQRSRL